jgi:hypothetical protein
LFLDHKLQTPPESKLFSKENGYKMFVLGKACDTLKVWSE